MGRRAYAPPPTRPTPRLKLRRRRTFQLEDGSTGYGMFPDRMDCLRAAIATVVQAPPSEMPDPRIMQRVLTGDDPEAIADDMWEMFERWLRTRGLKPVFHESPPTTHERWIGICGETTDDTATAIAHFGGTGRGNLRQMGRTAAAVQGFEHFTDHCLVMSYSRVLFDPAISAEPPPGMALRQWRSRDVGWGVSIEPIGGR